MNPRAPHQDAICQRQHNFTICKHPRHEHWGPLGLCPDGSGRTYKRHPTSKTRAGNTFTEQEARALEELAFGMLSGKLRNGQATEWTKRNAATLGRLGSKARRMLASLERMAKEERDGEQRQDLPTWVPPLLPVPGAEQDHSAGDGAVLPLPEDVPG